MIYVTDSHSLFWFLSEDNQLADDAKRVFEQAEAGETTIIIPTIVLAEFMRICEKKSIGNLFLSLIRQIQNSGTYATHDLSLETVLACQDSNKVTEIHDKIIVATARILDAPLITKDHEITNSGYVQTVW